MKITNLLKDLDTKNLITLKKSIEEELIQRNFKFTRIQYLKISTGLKNVLLPNIYYIEDIENYTYEDVELFRNMGKLRIDELKELMKKRNLKFKL